MSDKTAESKTVHKIPTDSKAREAAPKENANDSGSDYGENWSGDEWTDAQVLTPRCCALFPFLLVPKNHMAAICVLVHVWQT